MAARRHTVLNNVIGPVSTFVPACRQCRFLPIFFLTLFVDKVVFELLLLDRAAESAPRGRDAMRQHRGHRAGGHFQAVSGNLKIGRFYALNTPLPFDLNLAAVPTMPSRERPHVLCARTRAREHSHPRRPRELAG